MSFQLSPGVKVREIDLTTIIPAVATSEAGIGGVFRWGPVEKPLLVTNEDQLVARFGRPTNFNAETFFSAASFLAYSNALYVCRAFDTTARNAYAIVGAPVEDADLLVVKNEEHFDTIEQFAAVDFIAKYPGDMGNSLRVSVCGTAQAFSEDIDLGTDTIKLSVGSNTAVTTADLNDFAVGDIIKVGNTSIGYTYLTVSDTEVVVVTEDPEVTENVIHFKNRYTLAADLTTSEFTRYWEFWNVVDGAPGTSAYQFNTGNIVTDEVHVVVVDEEGKFTGVPGTILEVYQGLSRATGAKTADGGSNFYPEVINNRSRYIWSVNDVDGLVTGAAATLVEPTAEANDPYNVAFQGGVDTGSEGDIDLSAILFAYDEFKSAEDIDISLLINGKAHLDAPTLTNYLIDNVAEYRKDCVVFASPPRPAVVDSTAGDIEQLVVDYRGTLRSTSYAVLDSGYKYMYDKYNDVYRWVPLNGDTAGLCAKTDYERDAWWSPAGFNRGHIRNIVKLAWNPNQAQRDMLYKNGVNPIVNFAGQGIIMYGDKTLLSKPSAFDRINVRRLFIVLEKAIATAAKFTLFEFNDEFTRASFVNMVTPFLRDVQGRRGIYDFHVVCDDTNNTGEVIDRNEFIGDIYIKPARSINFITLNFVAVRTGVEFEEVIGQF